MLKALLLLPFQNIKLTIFVGIVVWCYLTIPPTVFMVLSAYAGLELALILLAIALADNKAEEKWLTKVIMPRLTRPIILGGMIVAFGAMYPAYAELTAKSIMLITPLALVYAGSLMVLLGWVQEKVEGTIKQKEVGKKSERAAASFTKKQKGQ